MEGKSLGGEEEFSGEILADGLELATEILAEGFKVGPLAAEKDFLGDLFSEVSELERATLEYGLALLEDPLLDVLMLWGGSTIVGVLIVRGSTWRGFCAASGFWSVDEATARVLVIALASANSCSSIVLIALAFVNSCSIIVTIALALANSCISMVLIALTSDNSLLTKSCGPTSLKGALEGAAGYTGDCSAPQAFCPERAPVKLKRPLEDNLRLQK